MPRATASEFHALDLECHALLADFPLHDVHVVDLPGPPGRTLLDLRAVVGARRSVHPVVRILFAIRRGLGRLFGWDDDRAAARPPGLDERLDPAVVARSHVAPGTREGPFRVIYVLDRESLHEIWNATVHAALVVAWTERIGGYRLWWAVHVRRTGWITRLYMALIDPFRRFLVYPLLLRGLRQEWIRREAERAGSSRQP